MNRFPLELPALKINQTFEGFYAISISAFDLLKVSFSDPMRYEDENTLVGHQRKLDLNKRVKEITNYIQGVDFAFPNSIIIAANYTDKGIVEDNEEKRWRITTDDIGHLTLVIPTDTKLASIIDGQHRLEGFKNTNEEFQKKTQLLVSVYFDLPNPYQAYLFATINYNQKPVDKSLALEQFGFQTNVTPSNTWSPELLSVFFAKKLNIDQDSPFKGRIKMAPIGSDIFLNQNLDADNWTVSTACIVRGILSLISTNPRNDSNDLKKYAIKFRDRNLLKYDETPLREFFIKNNDSFIYKIITNYFNSVNEMIFKNYKNSLITKTVGIDALFLVLKTILTENLAKDKDVSVTYFNNLVNKFSHIDFKDDFFSPSGKGTRRLANTILVALNMKQLSTIRNESDIESIRKILNLPSDR